jgi:4-carboxymuconolactone decarboxylase
MTDEGVKRLDYEAGLRTRRQVLGGAWVDKTLTNRTEFNTEFQELITRHAWNDVWGRDGLTEKTRRQIAMNMMLGVHAYEEFSLYVRAALDAPPASGLTPNEIKELLIMAATYCGVPVANHAFGLAGAIIAEWERSRQLMAGA